MFDSAGVAVVESRAPQWSEGNEWRIGDVTVFFDSVEVSSIASAVRLPSGITVVAEESGPRLLYFGADGTFLRTVGRRGDGPGEFRLLQHLGHAGDTVWVYDYAQARITRFDDSGELLDVVNLEPPLPSALAVGALADGSIVVIGQWQTNRARNAQGLLRDSVAVIRYVDGRRADTVAVIPGREFVQRADQNGRMVMSTAVLGRRAAAVTSSDRIVLGTQDDHALQLLSPDGRVLRAIRWDGGDLRLTRAEIETWIADRVAAVPANQRKELQALLSSSPVPEKRPSYGRLLVSNSGHLWVGDYAPADAEPNRWDVFDSNGVWLGPVLNPERFRILEVGTNWLLLVRVDAGGSEQLQLRELRPG